MMDIKALKKQYEDNPAQEKVKELEELMNKEVAEGNRDVSQISTDLSYYSELSYKTSQLQKAISDLEEALFMAENEQDAELKEMANEEITNQETKITSLEEEIKKIQIARKFVDEDDNRAAILEIRAGAGGDEAALFAADLFRMYKNYSLNNGWDMQIVESNITEGGGYKEVIEQIEVQPVAAKQHISFTQLWSGPFARRSLMLWLIWFGIVYSYYGIFTWLPSLLVQQGYSIVQSFEYVLGMILAQLPGYIAAAWLVEKLGRKATLAGFIGMCAVSAYFFGQADSVAMIMFWGCLMSFFNLGAWGVLYTYTPEQYPTNIRAFGSGWASAIGRMGGIIAPMVVTHMMVMQNGFSYVFMMFTAVLLAVALVIVVLGEETKGRTLESIGL